MKSSGVTVWPVVSYDNGMEFDISNSTMTKERYVTILDNIILPFFSNTGLSKRRLPPHTFAGKELAKPKTYLEGGLVDKALSYGQQVLPTWGSSISGCGFMWKKMLMFRLKWSEILLRNIIISAVCVEGNGGYMLNICCTFEVDFLWSFYFDTLLEEPYFCNQNI